MLDKIWQFWQTKSFAIITNNPVPGDCILRVISEKGDRALFERLSTPRPAPKVPLKSNWLVQQQQPICNEVVDHHLESGCKAGKPIWDTRRTRDVRGLTTGTGNSSGKLVQDPEPKVEQTQGVDSDLRLQEVSQAAIMQENARNQPAGEQSKNWIKQDFYSRRVGEGVIFSEESGRATHDMGNVELAELKQILETTQCPSCLKHVFVGMTMCQCGKLLRPNKSTLDRIREAFEALNAPYYRTVHQSCQEEGNVVIIPGNKTIIKPETH